jgi:hypothetical protein
VELRFDRKKKKYVFLLTLRTDFKPPPSHTSPLSMLSSLCLAGYIDTRAFFPLPAGTPWASIPPLATQFAAGMQCICDKTTDIQLALLTCLYVLNGTFPKPFLDYVMDLNDPATKHIADQRMADRLPEWLATLGTFKDPMFNLIRHCPQTCSYIARAFSINTSERPSVKQWLKLRELQPVKAIVLQRIAEALPVVQQKCAAIQGLHAQINEDSTSEAGLVQFWAAARAAEAAAAEAAAAEAAAAAALPAEQRPWSRSACCSRSYRCCSGLTDSSGPTMHEWCNPQVQRSQMMRPRGCMCQCQPRGDGRMGSQ